MPVINQQIPEYSYDKSTGRYKNVTNGRFVTVAEVRKAIDKVIESSKSDLLETALKLQAGKITLADWQMQTARNLKALHLATGMAASGGFANMTPTDFGYLGSLLKQQYQFLQRCAFDISSGKQQLDGRFIQRMNLYNQAARGTFEKMKQRSFEEAGFTEYRRILAIADHCQGCTDAALKGWQRIGTLPAISSTECRTNCKCTFEFR